MKMTIKLQSKPLVAGLNEKINVTLPLEKIYTDEAEYLEKLEAGEYYELNISKKSGKKSLSQNGYAWELIQSIAKSVNKSPLEVYKENVRETPNYVISRVKAEDYWGFTATWSSNGAGWFSEIITKDGEWVELINYYGMSAWNKEQTSSFIETLIQDANALGIPTNIER